jgi:hypothetical protein
MEWENNGDEMSSRIESENCNDSNIEQLPRIIMVPQLMRMVALPIPMVVLTRIIMVKNGTNSIYYYLLFNFII